MIPFVQDLNVTYGAAKPLSPLVTCVTANNPGPFTYTGTGTFIIGRKEVAIIDPGPLLPAHEAEINAAIEGKTLTHIFLTHHHADHSPLAIPLAAKHGAKIYGMPIKSGEGITEDAFEAGGDANFNPDVTIKGGELFMSPDWTLEAIHTPGHTSNHICYALHEENTLFSGDHIMGWSTSVISPPGGHMGDYLRALTDIKRRKFDILRPTHGAAITDAGSFIGAYIDHRLAREAGILAAVQSGHETIMDMVTHIYQGLDKRLYPAAAHSVLAHLIYLAEQGKITSDTPPSLGSRFATI